MSIWLVAVVLYRVQKVLMPGQGYEGVAEFVMDVITERGVNASSTVTGRCWRINFG